MKATGPKTFFACSGCGSVFARWMGRCPDCGAWDSLTEEKGAARPGRSAGSGSRKKSVPEVVLLSAVPTGAMTVIPSGIGEFDTVLGGGAVPGSTVLVGGEPGIGKSTLLLQVAGRMAQRGVASLYVSGEESAAQIKLRAERIGIRADFGVLTAVDVSGIVAAAEAAKPRILILDSIQTTFDPQLQSSPGTVSQVRECAAAMSEWARRNSAVAFLIGHVTKDGFIAGPKVLEHLVDAVLQFEGDRRQWIRILRCLKNRYGSTHEIGLFEMREEGLREVVDPSGLFVTGGGVKRPGAAVAVAIEGRRPLLLEIQSLVGDGSGGHPQRVVSGLDPKRIAILIAVLQNIAGVQLAGRDVYSSITGGYMTDEPAIDLASAIAIGSAALNKPVDPHTIFLGEIGLAGEVRAVPQLSRRLIEAEKTGFKAAVVPAIDARDLRYGGELDLHPVAGISEALEYL